MLSIFENKTKQIKTGLQHNRFHYTVSPIPFQYSYRHYNSYSHNHYHFDIISYVCVVFVNFLKIICGNFFPCECKLMEKWIFFFHCKYIFMVLNVLSVIELMLPVLCFTSINHSVTHVSLTCYFKYYDGLDDLQFIAAIFILHLFFISCVINLHKFSISR